MGFARLLRAAAIGAMLAVAACDTDEEQADNVAAPKAVPTQPVSVSGEAVASCYAAIEIGAPAPAPDRAVFVFVDQTTGLDPRLRATIETNHPRL